MGQRTRYKRHFLHLPRRKLRIPRKLDSRSTANWTPVPPQTGRLFQAQLDRRSEATRGGDAVYSVMVPPSMRGCSSGPGWRSGWRHPATVTTWKKLIFVAPQASSASAVARAAQCGQRVNEWGQAGDNAGHRPGRPAEARRRCPRLVPTLARWRHSRFVHTESAPASPQVRSQTSDAGPASTVAGAVGAASIPTLAVGAVRNFRRDSPARCSGWA